MAGMAVVHLTLVVIATAMPPGQRVHNPFAHRVGEFPGSSQDRLKASLAFHRNGLAYSCPVGHIEG
jgi:hypothetical protein